MRFCNSPRERRRRQLPEFLGERINMSAHVLQRVHTLWNIILQ